LGVFFILVKGKLINLMGSNPIGVDILTIATAFLFLFYGQFATASFAFGQGLLIDLFSGGMHGLFTFLYLMVYGCIFLGYRFFNLQQPKGQMILIALTVLVKKVLFFIMVSIFYENAAFSPNFVWLSVLTASVTGLIAPIVFYLFNSLRANSVEDTRIVSSESFEGLIN
jgi:rod shape-determining protein MreD